MLLPFCDSLLPCAARVGFRCWFAVVPDLFFDRFFSCMESTRRKRSEDLWCLRLRRVCVCVCPGSFHICFYICNSNVFACTGKEMIWPPSQNSLFFLLLLPVRLTCWARRLHVNYLALYIDACNVPCEQVSRNTKKNKKNKTVVFKEVINSGNVFTGW